MADLIQPTNITNDMTRSPGDKRKISSDKSLEQIIKKLKESKTNMLCQCPQKCSERIPQRSKDVLLKMFLEMDNENVQNTFLMKIIKVQPVANRLFSNKISNGKLLRRIHCKYKIPFIITRDLMSNINFDKDDSKEENDKFVESDSTEASRKSLDRNNCLDVCQKAFVNLFGLSDKRLKTVRELLIVKARQKQMKRIIDKEENEIEVSLAKDLAQSCLPLIGLFNNEDKQRVSDQLMTAINNDINVVNNFFYNQLWKPEYINLKPSE